MATTLKQWKHDAAGAGLLETCGNHVQESGNSTVESCGISVAWLQRFAESLKNVEPYESLESTEDIVDTVMVPLTAKLGMKTRLWDLVPSQHRGTPTWYIVHTWRGDFYELVDQVVNALAPEPLPGQKAQPADFKSKVFVWIDLVAIPQHRVANNASSLQTVRDTILSISEGVLFVIDKDLEIINRSWCAYEAWLTVYYGDLGRLHVVLPAANLHVHQINGLLELLRCLDMTRCQSTQPEDKAAIMQEVRRTAGVQRMQNLVSDSLRRLTHDTLRFSQKKEELTTYCAALLESGSYYQAQSVLGSMTNISDNESSLQEIRDIFKMYDTSSDGEMQENDFVNMLISAGWRADDANDIFASVNTDDDGGISYVEFENWWISTHREQNNVYLDCHPTCNSLRANLTLVTKYTERNNLLEQADLFGRYLILADNDMILPKGELLPAPPIRGDWSSQGEQIGFKLMAGEFKPAASMLYNLLLVNSEFLDIPLREIKNPKALDDDELLKTLVFLLDHGSKLLTSQGALAKRHIEWFSQASYDIHAGRTQVVSEPKAGVAKGARHLGDFSSIRMTVMSMYGKEEGVFSRSKVHAAQLCMSQVTAASKSGSSVPSYKGYSPAPTFSPNRNFSEPATSQVGGYFAPSPPPGSYGSKVAFRPHTKYAAHAEEPGQEEHAAADDSGDDLLRVASGAAKFASRLDAHCESEVGSLMRSISRSATAAKSGMARSLTSTNQYGSMEDAASRAIACLETSSTKVGRAVTPMPWTEFSSNQADSTNSAPLHPRVIQQASRRSLLNFQEQNDGKSLVLHPGALRQKSRKGLVDFHLHDDDSKSAPLHPGVAKQTTRRGSVDFHLQDDSVSAPLQQGVAKQASRRGSLDSHLHDDDSVSAPLHPGVAKQASTRGSVDFHLRDDSVSAPLQPGVAKQASRRGSVDFHLRDDSMSAPLHPGVAKQTSRRGSLDLHLQGSPKLYKLSVDVSSSVLCSKGSGDTAHSCSPLSTGNPSSGSPKPHPPPASSSSFHARAHNSMRRHSLNQPEPDDSPLLDSTPEELCHLMAALDCGGTAPQNLAAAAAPWHRGLVDLPAINAFTAVQAGGPKGIKSFLDSSGMQSAHKQAGGIALWSSMDSYSRGALEGAVVLVEHQSGSSSNGSYIGGPNSQAAADGGGRPCRISIGSSELGGRSRRNSIGSLGSSEVGGPSRKGSVSHDLGLSHRSSINTASESGGSGSPLPSIAAHMSKPTAPLKEGSHYGRRVGVVDQGGGASVPSNTDVSQEVQLRSKSFTFRKLSRMFSTQKLS